MAEAGCATFVELGPGRLLSGMAKRTIPDTKPLAVNTPDDLDRLLEDIAATPQTSAVGTHEGEHLFATERLVVSPGAGIFEPAHEVGEGTMLEPGQVVGTVGGQEVRSPFNGILMGVLAIAGERISTSQPVAWLRVA
jgi:[acyl-carrier-protein] S-malonyltransferase